MNKEISILKITEDNYHKYNNMIFWRINGRERTNAEKQKIKEKSFEKDINELNKEGFYVFAAEVDNRLVGWIHFLYMPKLGKWNSGILYVDELWVHPEYRRNSIATKLLTKMKEIKNELNIDRIRLYTNNPIAQKLYQKNGFDTKNYCVFMEKDL